MKEFILSHIKAIIASLLAVATVTTTAVTVYNITSDAVPMIIPSGQIMYFWSDVNQTKLVRPFPWVYVNDESREIVTLTGGNLGYNGVSHFVGLFIYRCPTVEKFRVKVNDISYFVKMGTVDESKMGNYGLSYGGEYFTLESWSRVSDLVSSSSNAIVNYNYVYGFTNNYNDIYEDFYEIDANGSAGSYYEFDNVEGYTYYYFGLRYQRNSQILADQYMVACSFRSPSSTPPLASPSYTPPPTPTPTPTPEPTPTVWVPDGNNSGGTSPDTNPGFYDKDGNFDMDGVQNTLGEGQGGNYAGVQDYFTSGGSGSTNENGTSSAVTPNDEKAMADFSTSAQDMFGSSGNAEDVFSWVENSEVFDWFSQDVMDDLMGTGTSTFSDPWYNEWSMLPDEYQPDEDGYINFYGRNR